ncbi:hypothetical protein [Ruixingdingia sedimenti]|uniref:Uncharacterized protein n=1 Tax=Ruixingdingia sedimenti TaxID=3073604 RepID=A0ABU1F5Y6_9RHOB|nr:hypothetical protein [Xinfangfangia sp. LG-4]MDR5652286.1 hypothetical protein [Xinfangfangia sp. LG-4]
MRSARRYLGVLGALAAGFLTWFLLEVLYVMTLGRVIPLTGIPTPGGAPVWIHVLNTGVKGAWAALAYGLVMRLVFGRVRWLRVALLWLVGLASAAALGGMAASGTISHDAGLLVALAGYGLIGMVIARDWVSR